MSRDWPAPAYRFSPPSCCCCCSRFLSLGRGGGISRTGLLRRHRPVTQPRGLGVSSGELGPSCLLSLRSAHARCDQNIETQPRLSREGTPGPSCPLFFVLRDSGRCCSQPANWRTLLVSRLHCTHNVRWVATGLRSFYKWQGVRIILLHSPCLLSVSQAAALFIFCLKLLSVSPLSLSGVWLRDPDVGGDKDSRSRSRSDQWGLVTSRGREHNFRIKAGRGKGCGRQRKSGPGWFYYLRGLWLRLWPLASEGWQQGNTRLISNVFVSAVCCGPAPRVTVRARPPIQGSFFRIFPFV